MSGRRRSAPPPIPVSVARDRLLNAMRTRDPFLAGSLTGADAEWLKGRRVCRVSFYFDLGDYMRRAERGR